MYWQQSTVLPTVPQVSDEATASTNNNNNNKGKVSVFVLAVTLPVSRLITRHAFYNFIITTLAQVFCGHPFHILINNWTHGAASRQSNQPHKLISCPSEGRRLSSPKHTHKTFEVFSILLVQSEVQFQG